MYLLNFYRKNVCIKYTVNLQIENVIEFKYLRELLVCSIFGQNGEKKVRRRSFKI